MSCVHGAGSRFENKDILDVEILLLRTEFESYDPYIQRVGNKVKKI